MKVIFEGSSYNMDSGETKGEAEVELEQPGEYSYAFLTIRADGKEVSVKVDANALYRAARCIGEES